MTLLLVERISRLLESGKTWPLDDDLLVLLRHQPIGAMAYGRGSDRLRAKLYLLAPVLSLIIAQLNERFA